MSEPVRYRLRPPKPGALFFVLNAWTRCLASHRNPYEKQCGFTKAHRHVAAAMIDRSDVVVACGVGDEVNGEVRGEDFIYGFAVGENRGRFSVLHFVYIKDGFRGRRIGTNLVTKITGGETKRVTITAVTKPWILRYAEMKYWRVAEMAPLYSLINELAPESSGPHEEHDVRVPPEH